MDDVSQRDIRDVITREDDFGHEMRVGSVLRSCSTMVLEHGGTYTDPVSDKPRQFDYRSWLTFGGTRLALAIECKNINPATPVVICGAPRAATEAFHDLIESRQGSFDDGDMVQVGLSSVTRRMSRDNRFYPAGQFVGKSLVRIQAEKKTISRSGESELYDRWAQAVSSAIELGTSAKFVARHLRLGNVFSAVLPIVVVPNNALWRAFYDDTGTLNSEPERVDECTFFIGREIEIAESGKPWFQTFTFSHVHFLTLTGLKSFLSTMVSDKTAWRCLFVDPTEAIKVSAGYPRDPANT
jgi:hypothetical protein